MTMLSEKKIVFVNPTVASWQWLLFQFPVTVQEFGSADFVDFSSDGDYFAVTASARVSWSFFK